jgi:hypothetical protein
MTNDSSNVNYASRVSQLTLSLFSLSSPGTACIADSTSWKNCFDFPLSNEIFYENSYRFYTHVRLSIIEESIPRDGRRIAPRQTGCVSAVLPLQRRDCTSCPKLRKGTRHVFDLP